jgi:hypothetical protein
MRSAEEFRAAQRLVAAGVNDACNCAPARYPSCPLSAGGHAVAQELRRDKNADTARLDEFIGPKTRAVPLTGVHYAA